VCIVSDGRSKINSRTLSVIAAMGCYQDGVAKNAVNGKPVTAHIYEYTSQSTSLSLYFGFAKLSSPKKTVSVTPPAKIGPQKEPAPIQIIFCLKEINQKKINSHRWFFNAFGPILEPNVCVLLDVGTMPGPDSIYVCHIPIEKTMTCANLSVGIASLEIIRHQFKRRRSLWRNRRPQG
jgi:chitin synthase